MFGVWGLRFRESGVQSLASKDGVWVLGCTVAEVVKHAVAVGLFRVKGLGFRVDGLGLRV